MATRRALAGFERQRALSITLPGATEDVKEFYLGMGGGERKSFKDAKSYKRRKRWLA